MMTRKERAARALEVALQRKRAYGELDGRQYPRRHARLGEITKCIVCGADIVQSGRGVAREVCAECRGAYGCAVRRAERILRIDAAAKVRPYEKPYIVRYDRNVSAGNAAVVAWRGRPCMGGGFMNSVAPLTPAWDAPREKQLHIKRRAKRD